MYALKCRANRAMIGHLGMMTGFLMILMRIFITQYQDLIPVVHPALTVLAMITFVMCLLTCLLSFVRFTHMRSDIIALIDGVISGAMSLAYILSLPFWFHMPEMPMLNMMFFNISFIISMILMALNILIVLQARRKIRLAALTHGAKALRHRGRPVKSRHIRTSGLAIIVVVTCLVITLGYHGASLAYHTIFHDTDLDVTSGLQVEFTGSNGSGVIKSIKKNIDYDKDNEKLKTFVKNIKYDYDDVDHLSNGDIVKFKAVYDRQTAADLHLHIVNPYTYIEVTGLGKLFKDGKDISETLINEMVLDADAQMWSKYLVTDKYKKMKNKYHITDVSIWFAKAKIPVEVDCAVVLYKIDVPPNETRPSTYYRVAYYKGLNEDYSSSTDKYWYCIYLKSETNDYITEQDVAENGLIQRFKNFTMTKIKDLDQPAYKPSVPVTVNPLEED